MELEGLMVNFFLLVLGEREIFFLFSLNKESIFFLLVLIRRIFFLFILCFIIIEIDRFYVDYIDKKY